MMSERLKVLVVGAGNIASAFDTDTNTDAARSHAKAYFLNSETLIHAAVEPDPVRREAFGRAWSCDRLYPALADIPQGIRPDIISVCTPTETHYEILKSCLRLNPKAVLIEKPLTSRLEDAHDIVGLYRKAGIPLSVNLPRKWSKVLSSLGSQLRAGELGVFRQFVGYYTKGVLHNGIHMVSLLQDLLGRIVEQKILSGIVDFKDTDPTVTAWLRTAEGHSGVLVGLDCRDTNIFELEIFTDRARIRLLNGCSDVEVSTRSPHPKYNGYHCYSNPKVSPGDQDQLLKYAVGSVVDVISKGASVVSPADEALAAMGICCSLQGDFCVAGRG